MMTYLTYAVVFVVVIILFIILYKIFRFIVSLLLIGVFVVVAYLTNPTENVHKTAVSAKADRHDIKLRGKKVVRENYYLFSLTGLEEGEEYRLIGAGAFTKVVIFSKP
jgi:hypothetical protein